MRKVTAGLFVSLDGVVESPEKWNSPYFDDEMGEAVGAAMAASDAMLLGRATYQEFASYWPKVSSDDQPFADHMNDTPKFVVSTTLQEPLEWNNSTLIKGNVAEEISRLKQEPGKNIAITGSGTLVRSLTQEAPLAALLAEHFTVFNYDRRGRGDSGDTPPYAVEREFEDLQALIDEAGGAAFVYGTSSGGALALEAAASELAVTELALWEVPYSLDESRRPPADQVERYNEMISAGRRGEAVEYFMSEVVGLPPEFVAPARTQPFWQAQEALAHTLAYDAAVMGDYSLPVAPAAPVVAPTLVIAGGASFPFMRETAKALAEVIPDAQHRTLNGQEHNVDPAVLAPVLEGFFDAQDGTQLGTPSAM
jgi:dihydrofolate reductase